MSQIDQFESVFRSATREIYEYSKVSILKILLITDLPIAESDALEQRCQSFLKTLGEGIEWFHLIDDASKRPSDVIKAVTDLEVDLVVTYRNLHSEHDKQIYSLGTHVDMLTQKTSVPILIMPHPDSEEYEKANFKNSDRVMAVTDHMNGDYSLVNTAVCFTGDTGTLFLTHIEDNRSFEHMMTAISQIPEIDTDMARELIATRLLKDPKDYIKTCQKTLEEAGLHLKVESKVAFGELLESYRKFIGEQEIDLLILHAKDEDQLAMHGMAYPIAIEFRQTPLLML